MYPKLLCANTRSLLPKLDLIRVSVNQQNIDCFISVESWLNNEHSDELLKFDGFLSFRDDRANRTGGGVIVWVRYSFSPVYFPLSDKPSEIECVAIILRSSKILLVACYIPPVPAVNLSCLLSRFFISVFDDFLSSHPSFSIILCGDFNRFNISEICENCNLINGYSGATYGCSQLDYVLLSENLYPNYNITVSAPFDFSTVPHKSLLATPNNNLMHPRPHDQLSVTYPFFDLRDSNVSNYVNAISGVDWNCLYRHEGSLDDKFRYFYFLLFEAFYRTIPVHTVKFSSRDKPWITPLVKHLINCRWKAYRCRNFSLFNHLKEKIRMEIVNAKNKWVKNMKSSNLWNVARSFSGKKSQDSMLYLYSQFSSTQEASDVINDALSNVFALSDTHLLVPFPFSYESCTIDPSIVFNLLSHLSIKKSSPDLPAVLFRASAHILCEPLSHLYNLCLAESRVPQILKNSVVTPIPKVSLPSISDLRPISLLPIPMKIFETILLNQYKSLFINNYGPEQYGFRPGSSTLCAMIRLSNFVLSQLDKPDICGVQLVSYDFTKAFDKLKFDVIVNRLIDCNFPYPLVCLLHSFLTDRRQCVRIGDVLSRQTQVMSGVPQGSVLGPYLFGIVAGSFTSTDASCLLIKYADDFTFCFPIYKNVCNSHVTVQHTRLMNWSEKFCLPLNMLKCKSLLVTYSPSCTYVNLLNVNRVDSLRLLGISLDSKFSFNAHINTVVSNASRKMFALRFIRPHVNKIEMKLLYVSLVRSIFEYCCPLFVGMSRRCAEKLEKVQRRFHRLMCGTSCDKDCLEPLSTRRTELSLRLLHRMMQPDHLLHQHLPPLLPSGRFQMPTQNTMRYSMDFIVYTCKLFNSLHKR